MRYDVPCAIHDVRYTFSRKEYRTSPIAHCASVTLLFGFLFLASIGLSQSASSFWQADSTASTLRVQRWLLVVIQVPIWEPP
ncbi:MAG: hypothetical protein R3B47_11655 [Bacteroidia bacterium]